MMADGTNGRDGDRLDRIEAALESVASTMRDMAENVARGFDTTTSMMRLLDSRMTVLEGQMTEILGRLRIIGEQFATHEHGDET